MCLVDGALDRGEFFGGAVHRCVREREGRAEAPEWIRGEITVVDDAAPDRRVGDLEQDRAAAARDQHRFGADIARSEWSAHIAPPYGGAVHHASRFIRGRCERNVQSAESS